MANLTSTTFAPTALPTPLGPAAPVGGAAAPAPFYEADLGASAATEALSQRLGLSAPKNIDDLDMAFAEVANTARRTQTETGNLSSAAQLAERETQLGQMDESIAAAAQTPNVFVAALNFILSTFFGITLHGAQDNANPPSSLDAQDASIEGAVVETGDKSARMLDRDLVRDIVQSDLPPDAGSANAVLDKATGLAAAVINIDQTIADLARADAPMNGGADSPMAAASGRLQLAV